MTYDEIPGWFDFSGAYDEIAQLVLPGEKIVEVGPYLGRSTVYLATKLRELEKWATIYAIDLFDGYDPFQGSFYDQLLQNLSQCKVLGMVVPIKMDSQKAAGLFKDGELAAVWLDSDKSYKHVQESLISWHRKVKKGGILGGFGLSEPEVERAVEEFTSALKLRLEVRQEGTWQSWIIPR